MKTGERDQARATRLVSPICRVRSNVNHTRLPKALGQSMGTRVLYLVRHGQYVTEESHRNYGQLTALGRRQARRTGKRMASAKIATIYHSDMPRAIETTEIIAEELGKVPTHSVRALREMLPPFPKRAGQQPRPRKELAEIRAVTAALTKKFFTAPTGKKVRVDLIVAHGNLIRYLVRLAMRDTAVDWWKMGTSNCGVTRIDFHRKGPCFLIQYNDIGHLPASMQSMM
jgi:serine/threonine-protein phosphatase PGAM5